MDIQNRCLNLLGFENLKKGYKVINRIGTSKYGQYYPQVKLSQAVMTSVPAVLEYLVKFQNHYTITTNCISKCIVSSIITTSISTSIYPGQAVTVMTSVPVVLGINSVI